MHVSGILLLCIGLLVVHCFSTITHECFIMFTTFRNHCVCFTVDIRILEVNFFLIIYKECLGGLLNSVAAVCCIISKLGLFSVVVLFWIGALLCCLGDVLLHWSNLYTAACKYSVISSSLHKPVKSWSGKQLLIFVVVYYVITFIVHCAWEVFSYKFQLTQMDPHNALCHIQSPTVLYTMLDAECSQQAPLWHVDFCQMLSTIDQQWSLVNGTWWWWMCCGEIFSRYKDWEKVPEEVPLFLEVPEFPYNTSRIGRGKHLRQKWDGSFQLFRQMPVVKDTQTHLQT